MDITLHIHLLSLSFILTVICLGIIISSADLDMQFDENRIHLGIIAWIVLIGYWVVKLIIFIIHLL